MERKEFIRSLALLSITAPTMTISELNKISGSFNNTKPMPVLFVGHGSPMNAIEENEFVKGWRQMGQSVPKPAAVLCISAHWETKGTFVTAMEKPPTIHDFGGFPQVLYEVQYPAAGSPAIAEKTKETVHSALVELDQKWGLDHGCWSVVKHLYPKADVPVLQMSLDYSKPAQFHFDLGRELNSLREKGVLIIGSGNIVHNLRMIAWDKMDMDAYGYDWAIEANEKMKVFILSDDHKHLINYKSQGKAFELSIPTPEHFLPLLYILSLKEDNEKISFFNDKIVAGSLSMTSLKIEKSS